MTTEVTNLLNQLNYVPSEDGSFLNNGLSSDGMTGNGLTNNGLTSGELSDDGMMVVSIDSTGDSTISTMAMTVAVPQYLGTPVEGLQAPYNTGTRGD